MIANTRETPYDTVVRLRSKIAGWPTREQLGTILNETAWIHRNAGWGLSAKPNGYNVPMPDGTLIASDILQLRGTTKLYDVFIRAGEDAVPTWGEVEYHGDPSGRPWVAPIPPGDDPGPGPGPEPEPEPEPPPDDDFDDLMAAIFEVRVALEELRRENRAQLEQIRQQVWTGTIKIGPWSGTTTLRPAR